METGFTIQDIIIITINCNNNRVINIKNAFQITIIQKAFLNIARIILANNKKILKLITILMTFLVKTQRTNTNIINITLITVTIVITFLINSSLFDLKF